MNRFQKILNKIGADKVLHAETCCLIVMLVGFFCESLGLSIELSCFVAGFIAWCAGIWKELYDEKTYGGFDWNDIKADVVGIVIGILIIVLIG